MKTHPQLQTVLLFGGAFDPPHNGHIHLLRSAIDTVQPDRVLVMPTGTSPHKASSLTPGRLRRQMCRCFLAVDDRVQLSGYELRRKGKSYTIDTVRWLRRRYPGAQLVLTMGSDMLLHFERWRDWQQLLQLTTLCGQCRQQDDLQALQAKAQALRALGGRVVLCPPVAVEVSSTQVRDAVRQGQDIRALVPPETARLIARRGLYRTLPGPAPIARAVRAALSKKRWRHTCGVARAAVRLAGRYGADRHKALLAALLHDYLKESSESEMLQIFAGDGIINGPSDTPQAAALAGLVPPDIASRSKAVWHGYAAAVVACRRFGILDREILSAVACHTCGKAGMSTLDKVLYLADMTSAERSYDGVETLRRLCKSDLDEAMCWALRHTIDYLHSQGKAVDGDSLAALRELETQKGESHESE